MKPNKAMNLQSGCERDEENPTKQQDCNLFPCSLKRLSQQIAVPDNLREMGTCTWVPAKSQSSSKSCLVPSPMERALLHLLHPS